MLKQSAAWIEGGVDKPVGLMLANDHQPPIFAYQLDYGAYSESGYNAWPNEATAIKFGACHVLDIPLFWSQYPFLPLFQGIFRPDNQTGYNALSDAMMGYVAQFAHAGNPGTVNGVAWEPWQVESKQPNRIVFNANATEAIITMSNQN
jgi:carboxylesterase type B